MEKWSRLKCLTRVVHIIDLLAQGGPRTKIISGGDDLLGSGAVGCTEKSAVWSLFIFLEYAYKRIGEAPLPVARVLSM